MWTYWLKRVRKTFAWSSRGLSRMEGHYAAGLTPQDFGDNLVVTIGAEVQVDVSTRAGKISCANAVPTSLEADIEGVRVP